jgi:uncharacterized protein YneF (UPF0154 family)
MKSDGVDPSAIVMLVVVSLLVGVFVGLIAGASGCVWL